ncbi:GAF domain-containing protein [Aquipuribacter hungaricus]|uniref:GAF domain-containing protein n=1 Tax=Aquipuribacter hungaricus TaxID=545624 RepID=A0ABV7WFP2_9MICO
MPFSRTRTAVPALPAPRDVEALEQVLVAFDTGVQDAQHARVLMTDALVRTLGLDYGCRWVQGADGRFSVAYETGSLAGRLPNSDRAFLPSEIPQALVGMAIRERRAVVERPDDPERKPAPGCPRWSVAHEHGARAAAVVPIFQPDGSVQAVMEFYGPVSMPRFDDEKWAAIARIASLARRQAMAAAQLQQGLQDRVAVTSVVTDVSAAPDVDTAIRVALDAVRRSFGWHYGSFWALDEEEGLLRFAVESGSAGEEFRKVTLAASFAEGVGLSGRAWAARDLVFVPDLAQVTDCVRAPAAQRAGVRSGVCFPVMDGDRVVGTMDFFVTETIELSESRGEALRNVQQLVSQRLSVLRRADEDARKSAELLQTVAALQQAADDAGRVAREATDRAAAMRTDLDGLAAASGAIDDVIQIISRIAAQTNLLALNATIEAARVGDLGKGFGVVANEVKELARSTATATQQVAQQVAALQTSSAGVAQGIHATSTTIEQLDDVQRRIGDVLAEQARMAAAFDAR